MVKYIKFFILAFIALAAVAYLSYQVVALKMELSELEDRHEGNIKALTEKAETYRLHDSIAVAQAAALELRAAEAGRTIEGLRGRVKELGARLKDVRSVTIMETVTRDTVFLPYETGGRGDTCLAYSDGWVDISVCDNGSGAGLTYSMRDSVTSYVHVSYGRRFLWWRWKPRYEVTITSNNPRTEITTASAIVISE